MASNRRVGIPSAHVHVLSVKEVFRFQGWKSTQNMGIRVVVTFIESSLFQRDLHVEVVPLYMYVYVISPLWLIHIVCVIPSIVPLCI